MLLGGIALSVLRLQGEPHVGRPTYGRINTLSMGMHSADYGQLLANSDPQHFEDSWMTSELWPFHNFITVYFRNVLRNRQLAAVG